MTTVINHDDEGAHKLNAYLVVYEETEQKAKEAADNLETLRLAIKGELGRLAPQGETSVHARSPYLLTPLHLKYTEQSRINTAKLRRDHPELAAEYTAPSGRWELRRST